MTISFKYKKQKRADGIERKLPYIPIQIKSKNSFWVNTTALVDSGADISIIPKDIAELLGIDLSGQKKTANGLGGTVEVVDSHISLKISNNHENYEISLPVQVVLTDTKAPVLLGRDGFFDKFVITFDHFSETIRLKYSQDGFRTGKIYK